MTGTTRVRDFRLVPLALLVWATALLCVYVPGAAGCCAAVLLLAALASFGMLIAGTRRHGGSRGGLPAVIAVTMAAAALSVVFATPAREQTVELDGRNIEVTGTVSSSSSTGSDGRAWFDAQTLAGTPSDGDVPAGVPVRIGVDRIPGLELGAVIRVRGQAMVTEAGERAALVVFGTEVEILRPAEGIFGIAAGVREDFVARALRLPEPGAGLLPGLAVGDTRAVSDELNEAMLLSGLSHLTAVSGANCAIVCGAVFWFVSICGGGRGLRVVLALGSLAAFVVLVTPEPSVIRASVMAGLAMTSLLCGRPGAGVGVLCLAVVGILVADPWLATTPGFALSAAATAALIVLAPPLARGMARWMPPPIALALAIPLAAQLACGPIIALFAEQQSLIGIPANMLAEPAAPIATVVGLLACLAAPIPLLADLLAASAWLPAAWIATTAHVSAAVPGGIIAVVPGVLAASAVALLSTAVGVVLSVDGLARSRLIRRLSHATLVIAAALLGGRMLLGGPLAPLTVPGTWSIAACDVGQGDALLVRSQHQIALIDTGIEDEPIADCLNALSISRIDLLVITHFDADHAGAAASLAGRIGTVLHGPARTDEEARLLQALEAGGSRVVEASAGMRGALGDARWEVLWPRAGSAAFPGGNDGSVVVEFSGGEVPRSLFLGDLGALPQRMLATDLRGQYAVVKVAHHGSADQHPDLYAQISPRVALYSAGIENTYGHPRREIIEVTESVGAVTLRTDLQGRILLAQEDGELLVWTERVRDTADGDEPE
ncbi:ComEC/Rec2 family competence protein [Microbacterium sp. GXF6406]